MIKKIPLSKLALPGAVLVYRNGWGPLLTEPLPAKTTLSSRKPSMDEAQQAALAALGSKATYTGASTTFLSWFISSEFGMICGLVIGFVGLLVNWYYKAKQDRREQAEHEKKMADK